MSKPLVLFLECVPRSEDELDVQSEIDATGLQLNQGPILVQHAVTPRLSTLTNALRQYAPTILHFSGHGMGPTRRAAVIKTTEGELTAEDLDSSLGSDATGIELIVMSACESEKFARDFLRLREAARFAIGTAADVDDAEVREFTGAFYARLAQNKSLAEAFNSASTAALVTARGRDPEVPDSHNRKYVLFIKVVDPDDPTKVDVRKYLGKAPKLGPASEYRVVDIKKEREADPWLDRIALLRTELLAARTFAEVEKVETGFKVLQEEMKEAKPQPSTGARESALQLQGMVTRARASSIAERETSVVADPITKNLWTLLVAAAARVPGGEWVFGPVALGAAAAIILGLFKQSARMTLFGLTSTFVFCLLFYAFAKGTKGTSTLAGPLRFLVWTVCVLFAIVLGTIYSSVFWARPMDLRWWLDPSARSSSKPPGESPAGSGGSSASAKEAGSGGSPSETGDPVVGSTTESTNSSSHSSSGTTTTGGHGSGSGSSGSGIVDNRPSCSTVKAQFLRGKTLPGTSGGCLEGSPTLKSKAFIDCKGGPTSAKWCE